MFKFKEFDIVVSDDMFCGVNVANKEVLLGNPANMRLEDLGGDNKGKEYNIKLYINEDISQNKLEVNDKVVFKGLEETEMYNLNLQEILNKFKEI